MYLLHLLLTHHFNVTLQVQVVNRSHNNVCTYGDLVTHSMIDPLGDLPLITGTINPWSKKQFYEPRIVRTRTLYICCKL